MAETSFEQQEPFLHHYHASEKGIESDQWAPRVSYRRYYSLLAWSLAGLLVASLTLNVWLLLYVKLGNVASVDTSAVSFKVPFSPADEALSYKLKSINTHDPGDPYGGPADESFDHAWSDLLQGASIRVTADELKAAGKQSLRLRNPHKEEYVAYLDSFHQLHCVKRMVQYRWPERYPDVAALGAFTDEHFNHCIQVLREGIMCSGDTTLNTYKWSPNNSSLITGVSDTPRKCVDWDGITAWARGRAVRDIYEVLTPDQEGFMGPK